MVEAHRRLDGARLTLREEHLAMAIGAAYYTMLYAARAALSERDLYAKTHRGTWSLFRDEFVRTGQFDKHLSRRVDDIRDERELADYGAKVPERGLVEAAVADAERFVAAVEEMLA